MTRLEQSFREYNANAGEELKEMNETRITNIIERGGIDDWNTVSICCML